MTHEVENEEMLNVLITVTLVKVKSGPVRIQGEVKSSFYLFPESYGTIVLYVSQPIMEIEGTSTVP